MLVKKAFLSIISLYFVNLQANQTEESSFRAIKAHLGKVGLYHDGKNFVVAKDNKAHEVKPYFIDPLLRKMNSEQLTKFQEKGFISVNQLNNGEYALRPYVRINGGGPLTGAIVYWGTKTLCYGTAVAAAATITVGTGGAAGAAGASTGATVVAGAIVGGGGAQVAALATGAAITTMGTQVVAGVETAAIGLSYLATICPFLP